MKDILAERQYYLDLKKYLSVEPKSVERFHISENSLEIDLLTFLDTPFRGTISIISNGLSNMKLSHGNEIIFTYDPTTLKENIDINAFLITYIQLYYLKNTDKVDIGDFFMMNFPIIKGYDFKGIYSIPPAYFPKDFQEKNQTVTFLWLIPIFEGEYMFLNNHGRNEFEKMLEKTDPDLTNLNRQPII